MTGAASKYILVIGTTFAVDLARYRAFRRVADMAGRALARAGLGLITGNPPGVDRIAAEAFWAECRRLDRAPEEAYRQLWLPHCQRGYIFPGAGFPAPKKCVERLEKKSEWTERAITLAGAGVMIGGRRMGALAIARRFIDAGKPVLPIPFSGGEARSVFHEVLQTWQEAPVPGLSQTQFMRLAIPWINDTGPLTNLLLGTLADTPDIFISYRRNDSGMAAGRLHADLVEHFGKRRVFMDLHGIVPSADWRATIEAAIAACKVGIVVIGPNWLGKDDSGQVRLQREDDVVRHELVALLSDSKTILPVLVDGALLPPADALPAQLRSLPEFQAPMINNANWASVVRQVIAAIEADLKRRATHGAAARQTAGGQ